MEKTTYEKLDKLIVDAVTASKSPLYDNATNEEARRIEKETGRDSDRVIDGRLQALRKKGVIRYCVKAKGDGQSGWALGPNAS